MAIRSCLQPTLPLFLSLVGCASSDAVPASSSGTAPKPEPTIAVQAPELGSGDHSAASVALSEIATTAAGLNAPRDLAFNPRRPDELWVLNFADDSVTIVHDAPSDGRVSEHRKDGYAVHFMPNPTAISFGQDATSFGVEGTFATCGESRNTYGDKSSPNDFMGPVLWSSDLEVFAQKNPKGLGSHLDMLHNSPLCVGIAHETANRYWVFGGLKNSIDRYDFKQDNNVGQDDHSDGESYQYATGEVKYVKGVPSHLFYNEPDAMLYIADTGNSRVAKLDTKSGTKGKAVTPKESMGTAVVMDGATLVDVVSSDSGLLAKPSGIKLRNGIIFVSDNESSRISAFDPSGKRVNYLDTGLPSGSLGGITFGADGKLYFVDTIGNRVLRVDAKKSASK